jgi:hypothetical protein
VLILRSPVHAAGNFHSDLTKDLQLKWNSLGSEVHGREEAAGCSKSGCKVFKSPEFSLSLAGLLGRRKKLAEGKI